MYRLISLLLNSEVLKPVFLHSWANSRNIHFSKSASPCFPAGFSTHLKPKSKGKSANKASIKPPNHLINPTINQLTGKNRFHAPAASFSPVLGQSQAHSLLSMVSRLGLRQLNSASKAASPAFRPGFSTHLKPKSKGKSANKLIN